MAITDKATPTTNGSRPVPTTLTALRSVGAAVIQCGALTGWPTAGPVHFMIYRVDTQGKKVPGSQTDWKGIVVGTTITQLVLKAGTDVGDSVGATVEAGPTAAWGEEVYEVIVQDHDPLGHHKTMTDTNGNEILEVGVTASAVNQVKVSNSATGNGPTLESSGDDADIDLNFKTKGKGQHKLNTVAFDPIHSFMNAIINGSCRVAQRTAPNLSTASQYGAVDRFRCHATGTAVSAGTINQTTSPNNSLTGHALKLAGVTVTGTGILFIRYRMESKDAIRFKNGLGSFGVKVYHDVGSAVNYTVYIRKANAANDFSAVTDIANSGAISVPNATPTTVKFENINSGNLGDVSNGIEIEIQVACGAVTTKNFEFAEFTFHNTSKVLPFIGYKSYEEEFAACQRYYETGRFFWVGYFQGVSSNGGSSVFWKVTKVKNPTFTQTNISVAGAAPATPSQADVTAEHALSFRGGTGAGAGQFTESWTSDAEL